MKLTLHRNDWVTTGPVLSYRVDLPNNNGTAFLTRMPNTAGWELAISHDGHITPRGTFGTTRDIVTLLEAEYFREPPS